MNEIVQNLKHIYEEIDLAIEKVHRSILDLTVYISSLTFTPVNWTDSWAFSYPLYIAIDRNGEISIYDSEQKRYVLFSELTVDQVMLLVNKLINLIVEGTIEAKPIGK